jgi:ketosteroid isomerase-like protein
MSQGNIDLVTEYLRLAFGSEREREQAYELLHPEAQLVNAPGSPFTNSSGHQGFRDWASEVEEVLEDVQVHVEDVIGAPDGKVLVISSLTARGPGTGLSMDMELHGVYTVEADLITLVEGYFERQQAVAAAGLSE